MDAAAIYLQDIMADNRQWRSAASSGHLRRIASGPRTTEGTIASVKQSHARYLELAGEALRLGDKIEAENFFQHAEHYFRVMRELSVTGTSAMKQLSDPAVCQ